MEKTQNLSVDVPMRRSRPRRDRGSSVAEYALLMALIAIAVVASFGLRQAISFDVTIDQNPSTVSVR